VECGDETACCFCFIRADKYIEKVPFQIFVKTVEAPSKDLLAFLLLLASCCKQKQNHCRLGIDWDQQ
jgi:hypothetical protein